MLPRMTPVVRSVLIACAVAYVLQVAVDRHTGGLFTEIFGLRRSALLSGDFWQLATYVFLHSGVWHLLMNMFCLYMFGGDVEEELGSARFVALFAACGVAAGAGWVLISGAPSVYCVGASGAVFGVMGAFAAAFPERRIALLFPPVVTTARTMVLVMAAIALLFLITEEGSVAHAAHLAGGVCGYAWIRHRLRSNRSAGWLDRLAARRRGLRVLRDDDSAPSREEVDAVLEKIKASGLDRLSRRERAVLERASRGKTSDAG